MSSGESAERPEPWLLIGRRGRQIVIIGLDREGSESSRHVLEEEQLSAFVAEREQQRAPRWVWSSAAEWYPHLLAAGVRVQRCHDLLLSRLILERVDDEEKTRLVPSGAWHRQDVPDPHAIINPSLFDMLPESDIELRRRDDIDESVSEFAAQRALLADQSDGRLALLCAAESAGGLMAEEMRAAGIPWSVETHTLLLEETLGEWSPAHRFPREIERAFAEVRDVLGDDKLRVESPPELLRALRGAGLDVSSTSKWELADHDHPVIEPLLRGKSLLRLHTANGRAWLDEWVAGGRFRPIYVAGGVVTGRWTSSGGGVLQIPRALRPAVRADPGWLLVSADVAQLEPRVLAAMSQDRAMSEAARGRDLYEGIVKQGAVADRSAAKYAVLGAMYGATTGESGRLVPRLRIAFPQAMALVDRAAETGENGGVVSSYLGRRSPRPDETWLSGQRRASEEDARDADVLAARRRRRDRGRFTRNFVVQASAAEWALVWLAEIRTRLQTLPQAATPAPASGPLFSERAHLAFFLHDEVIVHTPAEYADAVIEIVQESARQAALTLFGDFPIDFPLDIRCGEDAAKG